MPGCRCAVGPCNNSSRKTRSDKTILYHRFPSDPKRKRMWVHCCRRVGKWNPEISRICSIHFTSEDYTEKRKFELLNVTVKKVLKRTAVPSLFLKTEKEKNKKPPKKRQTGLWRIACSPTNGPTSYDPSSAQKLTKKVTGKKPCPSKILSCLPDNEYALPEDVAPFIECSSNSIVVQPVPSIIKIAPQENLLIEDDEVVQPVPPATVKIEPQENLLIEDDEGLDQKDQKIKSLQLRVWSLQRQAEQLRRSLRRIFSPDQLRHLASPESTANWSVGTIKECFLLKYVIGEKGYEYLYRKGFPIPSKHTLKSRMKDANVQEIKSQSIKDPEMAELSSTDSVRDDDETVNLYDSISQNLNENMDFFVVNTRLQDCDESIVSIEGDPIQVCDESIVSIEEDPIQVYDESIVSVEGDPIEDCDERMVSIKPDPIEECDESVNSNHADKIQILATATLSSTTAPVLEQYLTVDLHDIFHSVNLSGVNIVQNSAETAIETVTNCVQNSEKTEDLYDIVILQETEQDSYETVNPEDPDVKSVDDSLHKSDTVDDLSGMDWEISIEQDVYMCETDRVQKSALVWQTALAALNTL